jgi:hypothetical protein
MVNRADTQFVRCASRALLMTLKESAFSRRMSIHPLLIRRRAVDIASEGRSSAAAVYRDGVATGLSGRWYEQDQRINNAGGGATVCFQHGGVALRHGGAFVGAPPRLSTFAAIKALGAIGGVRRGGR